MALLFVTPQKGISQIQYLNAKVITRSDSSILKGVHIINLNSKKATNTDEFGTFHMPFKYGDTIKLTSIGFYDQYIFTKDIILPERLLVSIVMTEQVYDLEGVVVNPYNSKQEFDDEFMQQAPIILPNDDLFDYQPPSELKEVSTDLNAKIVISSPISFLYNKFGREARQANKVKKVKDQIHREETIKAKYNANVVRRVTGITSVEEANQFMKFCDLKDDFIFQAKEYDVVKAILDCHKNFKSQ